MNYYSRYPSHYLAATLHLTMEQDGAYGRLMDWYYSNERPIPDSKRTAIGRAITRKERLAIDYILNAFFDRSEDGTEWTQKRIESEIDKSAPKIQAARENGRKGGRPRKQEPTGFPENNPLGFSNVTQTEPSTKAPQSPIYLQKQDQEQERGENSGKPTAPPAATPKPARGSRMTQDWRPSPAMYSEAQRIDPMIDVDAEADRFRDYFLSMTGAKASKADWAATWRNWIRRASEFSPRKTNGYNGQSKTLSGIQKLQAMRTHEYEPERLAAERDPERLIEADDTKP